LAVIVRRAVRVGIIHCDDQVRLLARLHGRHWLSTSVRQPPYQGGLEEAFAEQHKRKPMQRDCSAGERAFQKLKSSEL
jgi:hypothetical protein